MSNIITLAQLIAQLLNTNPQDMKNTQFIPLNPVQYVMIDEKKEEKISPSLAAPMFHGRVWRDLYGAGADSADVIITNKNGIDTVMARVGRTGTTSYYSRTVPDGWGLVIGDIVIIKAKDIDGDSAKTWRNVTSATGANLVIDLFTENVYNTHKGHSLLIKAVKDDLIDSVDAKCWVKGKPDTLQDRFRRNTSFYNIAFNAENFPTASRPTLGDSIFFKMTTGTYAAESKGLYLNQFIDGDTFPSCSLRLLGVTEEQLERKLRDNRLIITPNPSKGMIVLPSQFKGFLYDASGRKIMDIKNEKLDLRNYSNGVYFVTDIDNKQRGKLTLLK